ncbi:MAG: glucose-6-phosphate isomerase [Alphaproteobacteria bacterium]|jgi:glucose-6-phosphate isomerase|nr:glucose-6-phosphate isomerase [Alphaproteobacteria bacterium]MBT5389370.1 glucose-6-phosphate isomerase [Alphaproteobacteria bacterium]MBT5539999.1 glucose-6-phosphate isomerase [Alphaproteobacteria bacterium]MBT5654323.1 glucose-6-phosphate isomerase [Alphaproteobacteria bacterium]
MSTYLQDITGCIGKNTQFHIQDLSDQLEKITPLFDAFKKDPKSQNWPFIKCLQDSQVLDSLHSYIQTYTSHFSNILILGTGGSSLAGQAFHVLKKPSTKPTLYFLDNIDPHTFATQLNKLCLKDTGVIAISKSGTTAETNAQLLLCLEAWKKEVGERELRTYFTLLTEDKDSPMKRIGVEHNLPFIPHDPQVGGRFSALSSVGLIPALLSGLNPNKILEGAQEVLSETINATIPHDAPPLVGAAISVGLNQKANVNQTVMMPYVDRLSIFSKWYRQLWAESLGKQGRGTTPICALGAVDQHSQLQLYLDGPKDKMFTLLLKEPAESGTPIKTNDPALAYLNGHTLETLIEAEQEATKETLLKNGCPTRVFYLPSICEKTIGALMMHFMLETVFAAKLLDVDPFDQPAVEQGKILTRERLSI